MVDVKAEVPAEVLEELQRQANLNAEVRVVVCYEGRYEIVHPRDVGEGQVLARRSPDMGSKFEV